MNFDLIKKIDFGEIDGYGDPNIEKYFPLCSIGK